MDAVLCGELLQEIFQRLSSSSSSSVSLVSKRWLHHFRNSRTSLCLRFAPREFIIPSLSSLLASYPFISSLSLSSSENPCTVFFSELLLLSISSCCDRLRHLRFLPGPVSASSLLSLSETCRHLTSLNIILSRPFVFNWVISFPSLKELSVNITGEDGIFHRKFDRELDIELGLESLSFSGICNGDESIGWLWRNSRKLKKLKLKSCEGIGDGGSFSSFILCLQGLEEVELRTCRTIADEVLLKLAEHCCNLSSLLVYDGGSKQGLLQFISLCRSKLAELDFRLPLDFENDHVLALAHNFPNLSSLKLQRCCLVTGESLNGMGVAMSNGLEELALVCCDVVEREPGVLTTLGQNLKKLRKLDLSYNEMLPDKELMSMLVSCNSLKELNLRGCRGLTNLSVVSLSKSCKRLESVNLLYCFRIEGDAIESLIRNSPQLKRLEVEESKLSEATRSWAAHKLVEVKA